MTKSLFLLFSRYFGGKTSRVRSSGTNLEEEKGFLHTFDESRKIRHTFADTGLYPFNHLRVIQPILRRTGNGLELQIFDAEYESQQAQPLFPSETNFPPSRATLVRNEPWNVLKVSKLIQKEGNSPKLHRAISKLLDLYHTTTEYLDQTTNFPQYTSNKQEKRLRKGLQSTD